MLNKRGCIIILLAFWANLSWAQLKDSVDLSQNTYHKNSLQNLLAQPLLYSQYRYKNFTQSSVAFVQEKRRFKRVQTPLKNTEWRFNTKGLYAINSRLRLYGKFLFTKSFEKDLGYTLGLERSTNRPVLDPHYFFAPKKADWESQFYQIAGGASYLLSKNWSFALNVGYENQQAYRLQDPRPEITAAFYKANAHLGYTQGKHKIAAQVGIGRRTENHQSLYVDDALNSPAYPDTFTQFSSGYGLVTFNESYFKHLRREIPKTWGFAYQYSATSWALSGAYTYHTGVSKLYAADANNQIYYDESLVSHAYRKEKQNLRIQGDYEGNKLDASWGLHYKHTQGDNYIEQAEGQNFRLTEEQIGFNLKLLREERERILWQTQANMNLFVGEYIDLLGYTHKEIQTLVTEIEIGRTIYQKNNHNLFVALQSLYSHALQQKLDWQQVTENTTFIDEVVFPDHAYERTNRLLTGLTAAYTRSIDNERSLRLRLQYALETALHPVDKNLNFDANNKINSFVGFCITLSY